MNIPINNLTLRALRIDDSIHFFELIDRNRIRLKDFFPQTIAMITDREASSKYVDGKMQEAINREAFSYVLEDDNGKLQGYISVKNIDWAVPKCELAYFIDKRHEGMGIMSEALSAIVAHCFDTLLMNKVYLVTAMDNHPSKKTAEKNGFEIEGVLRNNFKLSSGVLVNMAYYGILRKEK